MRTIHKFTLNVTDAQVVGIPKNADVLCVQVQHGVPCIWAHVDTDLEMEDRVVHIVGTGHDARRLNYPKDTDYIGTFQLADGDLVFHVFIN